MMVHEEHFDLHMLEEDQAFEFPFGASNTFMEETKKNTIVQPISGGGHAFTNLMDASHMDMGFFCSTLFHTLMEAIAHGDEYWVKGLFLLVPHEEWEAPTISLDDLMVRPLGLTSAPTPYQFDEKNGNL